MNQPTSLGVAIALSPSNKAYAEVNDGLVTEYVAVQQLFNGGLASHYHVWHARSDGTLGEADTFNLDKLKIYNVDPQARIWIGI